MKVQSYMLVNLASSDFLMGIYLLIIGAMDVYFRGNYAVHDILWRSSGLCSLAGFLSTFSGELSVLTLTVITIDRFIVIALNVQTKKIPLHQLKVILAGLWITTLMICLSPYFDSSYFGRFYGQTEMCLPVPIASERQVDVKSASGDFYDRRPLQNTSNYPSGWEYSVFVFVAINGAAFLLILIMYVWMFISVIKTQAAARSTDFKADLQLARKMLLLVATDACCWIPVVALGIYSLQGNTLPQRVSWASSSACS